jgi:hypothetical protein
MRPSRVVGHWNGYWRVRRRGGTLFSNEATHETSNSSPGAGRIDEATPAPENFESKGRNTLLSTDFNTAQLRCA